MTTSRRTARYLSASAMAGRSFSPASRVTWRLTACSTRRGTTNRPSASWKRQHHDGPVHPKDRLYDLHRRAAGKGVAGAHRGGGFPEKFFGETRRKQAPERRP